jgi:phosphoglycolate phosphatase-like HAD superfamily hydrolase
MRKELILVCDWDKSLSPVYMPSVYIKKHTKLTDSEYWKLVNDPSSPVKTPELAYLWSLSRQVLEPDFFDTELTRSKLEELGQTIPLCPGALDFLSQMWGRGIQIHIVTTGLTHFLAQHPARRYITSVHGSSYADEGLQTVAEIITAADKVRCLHEISNGDLSRIVYIGDGGSDYWAMKAAIEGGGMAAGVWDTSLPRSITQVVQLQKDLGLNFISEADYREGSSLRTWLWNIFFSGRSKFEHLL